MIAKGNQHNDGAKLARYLITGKGGERAELWELRGFASDSIEDALRSVHVMAEATRCEQPFFHVQVRNPNGEELTRDQWAAIANRIESKLGLRGQPRAISFHTEEANGHEHMHLVWSRINEETLTAKNMPFFKERLKEVSRELEIKFGLTRVPNEREDSIKYAPTRDEDEQARRLGVDVHDARQTILDCYDRSDCGISFQAALEHEGLTLARGDRRDFVVIDHAGGMYALGKRILGVTAAQIRERLSDLAREEFPTIEQARAYIPEKQPDREQRLNGKLAELDKQMESEQRQQEKEMQRPEPEEAQRIIFMALLGQAIRQPELLPEVQMLAWKMPADFAIELNESIAAIQEAQERNLDFADIEALIDARERHAAQTELAEIDGVLLTAKNAPVLAYVALADQQRQHENEMATLDHAIYAALLGRSIRDPHSTLDIQTLAWKMPTNFAVELDNSIDAIRQIQARNLDLGTIDGMISAATCELRREEMEQLDETLAAALFERWSKYPNYYQAHIQPGIPAGVAIEYEKLAASETEQAFAMRDPVREKLAWQDAIAHAAIEKEKIERNFAEPKPREIRAERKQPPAPQLGQTAGDIRLAYSLSDSAAGFVQNLDERGIKLAFVGKEEAERSHRNAAFSREVGRFAPEFREGEYVAITPRGHVYGLNRATTGEDRAGIEKFMGTLDGWRFPGIDSVRRKMEAERRAENEKCRAEDKLRNERPLNETAASIRLAYSLSHSPAGFIKNLDEIGLKLAQATKEEAERSHRNAAFAREGGRFTPEYQEGEYVAITGRGQVYSLSECTTGNSRENVNGFMRTLGPAKIQGIEATRQHVAGYKRPAPARELWTDPLQATLEGTFSGGLKLRSLTPEQQSGRAAYELTERAGSSPTRRDWKTWYEEQTNPFGPQPSAQIRTAYERSDNARAFVATLEDINIEIARVTRDDVAAHQIDNFYAGQQGKYRPEYREGEYVAITDTGLIYRLNQRTTGQSAAHMQKFMATLDARPVPSIEVTLKAVEERYAARDTKRQAFRDLSGIAVLKREIDPRPWTPPLSPARAARSAKRIIGKTIDAAEGLIPPVRVGHLAGKTIGKTLEVVASAVESLLSPTLTPQQKYQGEKSRLQRETEAEKTLELSKDAAAYAHQRQQLENDREAARERQRDDRER